MLLVRLQEAPGAGIAARRRPAPRAARAWTAAARSVRQRWSGARCRDERFPRPVPRGGAVQTRCGCACFCAGGVAGWSRRASAGVVWASLCAAVPSPAKRPLWRGPRATRRRADGAAPSRVLTGPHGTPSARARELSPLLALADDDTPCRRCPRSRSLRGDRAARGRSASSPPSSGAASGGGTAAGRSGVRPDASCWSRGHGSPGLQAPASRRRSVCWPCPPRRPGVRWMAVPSVGSERPQDERKEMPPEGPVAAPGGAGEPLPAARLGSRSGVPGSSPEWAPCSAGRLPPRLLVACLCVTGKEKGRRESGGGRVSSGAGSGTGPLART